MLYEVITAAPASLLKLYGSNNGFGWKHDEIVGAQVVSVPMNVPVENANRAFYTFMLSLAAIVITSYSIHYTKLYENNE